MVLYHKKHMKFWILLKKTIYRGVKMITKEMIIENGWGFEEIIDNADDDELELIESCNGDLAMLLDNL